MKTSMNQNYQATSISIAHPRIGVGRDMRIIAFPREFQKDFIKSIDRRMTLIFLFCLMCVSGPLAYQASQPKVISSGVISSRILKKLGQVMRVDPRLLDEIDKPKTETETNQAQNVNTTIIRSNRTSIRGNAADRLNRVNQARQAASDRALRASQEARNRGLMAVVGAQVDGAGKYSSVDLTSSGVKLDHILDQLSGIEMAENSDDRTVVGGQQLNGNRGGSIDDLTQLLGASQTLSVVAGDANHGIIGVGNVTVTGGSRMNASAADFQAIFEQQALSINACYTKELKRTPDIKGKLSLQIKINPVGNVSGLMATENTIGNAVGQCVQNKIRSWKFPKGHKGMITINQTFVFSK